MPQPLLLNGLRRTVFEYMEPNFRFHLSLHLPSLRSIEKGTCLKIKELIFKDNTITIDKTEYKLGIYRKYEIEGLFKTNGTVYHDVDEFGYTENTNGIMMSGDVFMNNAIKSIGDGIREIRLEDGISGGDEQEGTTQMQIYFKIDNQT
ncbi:hypothetical protein B9Z55_000168 [Caenorhabditis nigoni]|uniref:Uncharacterized protein n=1 Tax=Caenorhabditis nigoni TaxID=1611254 RepID=A0A2G5VGU9_9PELO|nr:hypothetical protein B9Z55_000168 [Caenorhabditis nigoni]